jgi:hypothetical protein
MIEETFLVGFDADGGLEKKPVAEMTAAEVIAALDIANGMIDHLDAKAKQAVASADAGVALLAQQAAREAARRHMLLMDAVEELIPEWAATEMDLGEALERYWPRGRS